VSIRWDQMPEGRYYADGTPIICPKVGHVVRPSREVRGFDPAWDSQIGDLTTAVGIVVECVGIRCKVHWQSGNTCELPRRELEVISVGQ